MRRLLNPLDLDLVIEQGGHSVHLTGSGTDVTATFPTMKSLAHFSRVGFSLRDLLPPEVSLRFKCGAVSMRVKRGEAAQQESE